MTNEEIIEMARQAGFDISKPNRIIVRHSNGSWISIKFELEAFAKLVEERTAAKEREACAKIVEPSEDHRANPNDYIAEEQGIDLLDGVAAKIRARGEE